MRLSAILLPLAALLDNFCWGNPILSPENPDGDYKLGQLVRAVQGCYDAAKGYGTPYISGKDSFHNEFEIGGKTQSIPGTLLISAVALVPDVDLVVSMDVKRPGDLVYLVGETHGELGGSHYYFIQNLIGRSVPRVYPGNALKIYRNMLRGVKAGILESAHDCSEGGIAVALAEKAFAGGFGMRIDLSGIKTNLRSDTFLFSESNSRFVVTVRKRHRAEFEKLFRNIPLALIGTVIRKPEFHVTGLNKKTVIHANGNKIADSLIDCRHRHPIGIDESVPRINTI